MTTTDHVADLPHTYPHHGRGFHDADPEPRARVLLDFAIIRGALIAVGDRAGAPAGFVEPAHVAAIEKMGRLFRAVSALMDRALVAEEADESLTATACYELLAAFAVGSHNGAAAAAESLVDGLADTEPDHLWLAFGYEVWAVDEHAFAADKVVDAHSAPHARALALARNTAPALALALDAVLDHVNAMDGAAVAIQPTWLLELVADAVAGTAQPAGFPPQWTAFRGRGAHYPWSLSRTAEGLQVAQLHAETGTFGIALTRTGWVSVGFRPYRSNLGTLAHVGVFRDIETAHAFTMLAAAAEFAGWDAHPSVKLPRVDELLPPGISIDRTPHPLGLGVASTVVVDGQPVAWFPLTPRPPLSPNEYAGMHGAVMCAHVARQRLDALAGRFTGAEGTPA